MPRSIAASTLLMFATAMATPSLAAPPADQDACNALAFSLAEKATTKKLAEADAKKVDEMIAQLEGQCAEGKLADAEGTAKEIEAALGK